MIKLKELIDKVDELKPNAYTAEQKTDILNRVEGQVQSEVFLWGPQDIVVYDYKTCADHELLVIPPFDKLYVDYLCAMIDYYNGEYERYQNSMEMFNASYSEFVSWYILNYRPADRDGGCCCGEL